MASSSALVLTESPIAASLMDGESLAVLGDEDKELAELSMQLEEAQQRLLVQKLELKKRKIAKAANQSQDNLSKDLSEELDRQRVEEIAQLKLQVGSLTTQLQTKTDEFESLKAEIQTISAQVAQLLQANAESQAVMFHEHALAERLQQRLGQTEEQRIVQEKVLAERHDMIVATNTARIVAESQQASLQQRNEVEMLAAALATERGEHVR